MALRIMSISTLLGAQPCRSINIPRTLRLLPCAQSQFKIIECWLAHACLPHQRAVLRPAAYIVIGRPTATAPIDQFKCGTHSGSENCVSGRRVGNAYLGAALLWSEHQDRIMKIIACCVGATLALAGLLGAKPAQAHPVGLPGAISSTAELQSYWCWGTNIGNPQRYVMATSITEARWIYAAEVGIPPRSANCRRQDP